MIISKFLTLFIITSVYSLQTHQSEIVLPIIQSALTDLVPQFGFDPFYQNHSIKSSVWSILEILNNPYRYKHPKKLYRHGFNLKQLKIIFKNIVDLLQKQALGSPSKDSIKTILELIEKFKVWVDGHELSEIIRKIQKHLVDVQDGLDTQNDIPIVTGFKLQRIINKKGIFIFHKTVAVTVGRFDLPVKLIYHGTVYILIKHLGSGVSGSSFQAQICDGKYDVVVKVLYEHGWTDSTETFKREVKNLKITKRLVHADSKNQIMIFKMIPGITFAEYLSHKVLEFKSQIGLSNSARQHLLKKVNEYLSLGKRFRDQYGLIHGDIRPLNVIIRPDDIMELIDLGESKPSFFGSVEADQTEYDYARLELYCWVTWAFFDAENSTKDDFYRYILVVRAIPGRERVGQKLCRMYQDKYGLPDTCKNLDIQDQKLKSKMNILLKKGPNTASRQEVIALALEFRKRFMFHEEGKLRILLCSIPK